MNGVSIRRVALFLTAALGLGLPPAAGAQGVGPSPCARLDASVRAQFAPGARVEILLAAGNTVPDGMQQSYREMATAVLGCLGEGSRVELFPITDSAYGSAPVFSGEIAPPPPGNTNPLWGPNERGKLTSAAGTAIDQVLRPRRYDGFDPLSALSAAGEALHREPLHAKRIVVMIGNGWPQTKSLDLFHYGRNPAARAPAVIRMMKADHTLPNLQDTTVFVVGFDSGVRWMNMRARAMQGLCDFWDALIRASGGTKALHDCPPTLPGLTLPLR